MQDELYFSELESEFEADGEFELETRIEEPISSEYEYEDDIASEYEYEDTSVFELEMDENSELAFENFIEDGEFESLDPVRDGFAARLSDIATANYESEFEFEYALNQVLDDIEKEYFFKKLLKKASPFLKKAAKFALDQGLKFAKGTPIGKVVDAASQLAKGNLKGALGSIAKAAITSFVPGGQVIAPALSTLGILKEAGEYEESEKVWQNFVDMSKGAYEYLAENIDEKHIKDPIEANKLASRAYEASVKKLLARNSNILGGFAGTVTMRNGKTNRVVKANKGDHIIIQIV